MKKLAFFYDPIFVKYDMGYSHPLRQERIRLHYELCRALKLTHASNVFVMEVPPATTQHLELVHTKNYIHRVQFLSQQSGFHLLDGGDTYTFPKAFEISKTIVGASIAGVDAFMQGDVHYSWNPA